MPLERLHGRDSRARNATPRLRPTPVRRDQRAAVAQPTERFRAATRREPVPRFRRQLLSLLVLRESVSSPQSWCGSRASPLRRTANWTGDQLERGDYSLDEPPCCTTALNSAAIKLRICQFTARSCASTRLRDRRWAPICRKQTSSFDIAVTQQRRILLTQRKLTCVNAEVSSGVPQFPIW